VAVHKKQEVVVWCRQDTCIWATEGQRLFGPLSEFVYFHKICTFWEGNLKAYASPFQVQRNGLPNSGSRLMAQHKDYGAVPVPKDLTHALRQ
jgi:hypothetical protein